jgi:hypothetical protein
MQKRILIVIEDGTFKGASITTDTGVPTPIDQADLAAVLPDLNAAALAEIERLHASHAAEIKELQAAHAAALAGSHPNSISKLTLKRRLDALGKWAEFKTFLENLGADAVDEFALAAEIRQDDAVFQQLAPMAKAALNLTDEQYVALLTP